MKITKLNFWGLKKNVSEKKNAQILKWHNFYSIKDYLKIS